MNAVEIQSLARQNPFSPETGPLETLETHVSWLLFSPQFVYKIKKPVKYAFLDFSTLKQRIYYCRREVMLNSGWSPDIYLKHIPIYQVGNRYELTRSAESELVEYGVKMHRIPAEEHLPYRLKRGFVQAHEMYALGAELARLHYSAPAITVERPLALRRRNFEDLQSIVPQIAYWPSIYRKVVEALLVSDRFLIRHGGQIEHRAATHWFRDTHGDLHIENIFLGAKPVFIDCVEFDDAMRQTDVLDELAFLAMDLEAHGNLELSEALQAGYRSAFPAAISQEDHLLFVYYKLYRANVRLKVQLLRLVKAETPSPELRIQIYRYAGMMHEYAERLQAEMSLDLVSDSM